MNKEIGLTDEGCDTEESATPRVGVERIVMPICEDCGKKIGGGICYCKLTQHDKKVVDSLVTVGEYKFKNVSCSQCGGSFGPGNSGYSHCEDHARTKFSFWYEDEDGVPCQEEIITTYRNACEMYDSGLYSLPMVSSA